MSHVTHMNESCHKYECLLLHIRMSHVKLADAQHPAVGMNESCHIRMSHVTHMTESCHTYECLLLHIGMSHVTHADAQHPTIRMNESCHV